MFQNVDLDSGLSVFILEFSDKKIVSFKVYNVTRKIYEYFEYTVTLIPTSCSTQYDDQIHPMVLLSAGWIAILCNENQIKCVKVSHTIQRLIVSKGASSY